MCDDPLWCTAQQARDRARLAKWSAWADGLAALLAGVGAGGGLE